VEQSALLDEPLGRCLDVQQARPGRHPLGVAVGDRAATAVAVVVVEDAVDDVGDGLEAAVRVPRRALGLAGRVLDLAHLVHVNERVEGAEVDARECPPHREPFTLQAGRRGGDRHDRTVGVDRRVGEWEARQRQGAFDGHGWHRILLRARR